MKKIYGLSIFKLQSCYNKNLKIKKEIIMIYFLRIINLFYFLVLVYIKNQCNNLFYDIKILYYF